MNWTGGAALNSENLNLIASTPIAAAYAGHSHHRLALSSSYAATRLVPQARSGRFQIGITDAIKLDQDDRFGGVKLPRAGSLEGLQPPEIVGQVGNPVLEAVRRSGGEFSIESAIASRSFDCRSSTGYTDQNRPHPLMGLREIATFSVGRGHGAA